MPISSPAGREFGLAPIIGSEPKVLILGSFPSRMSIEKGLYYANPRNHFWRIMRIILDIRGDEEIHHIYSRLKDHRIAVWDVIESREFQPGSMDHDIKNARMNDIPGFLEMYPTIRFIGLNGSKAWTCFLRVISGKNIPNELVFRRLPSTSPANARYSLEKKSGNGG
jgi:TDG/mug DNA glycosylase family protein